MPYIEAKFTMALDEAKKTAVCEKIENAVSGNFRKPKSFVMTEIKDNTPLRMAGAAMKKGAYISVSLFGEAAKASCSSCTSEICSILKKELEIDGKNIYIVYKPEMLWGWDGQMF